MSNRLKRKLGDLGVDPKSARANESFCLIGTPLPPLEKSKDNGEFVPLWKQDVRDEKGRRRLHGAFTGGFSAGYFNTVGSKEGWAPSTFVSSRGDRAKQKAARPEDFMDEEDLQELKDSQNLVDTAEEMDFIGGTKAELNRRGGADEAEDSIASVLEASMLPTPKDSPGARILKKMGWRLGQGIGPRITWRQRKLQDMQAGMSADDIKMPEDDEEASKHTYAPRDTPILQVGRKDNSHGLGYRPGIGLNESIGAEGSGAVSGPKISAGFGLGALNDADDDDVDIYDKGMNYGRARTAYDTADREEEDKIVIGGRGDKGRGHKPPVRLATSSGTFQDGRPVLAGFILSDKPVAEDRWFPMPDVPKGWTPNPKRIWEQGANKENVKSEQPIPSHPVEHAKWKTGISADQRGTMLGETPLPSAPRSVFEYMSQKDRECLKNISVGNSTFPSFVPTSSSAPAVPLTITIPRTEPHIAHAALRGFKPFTTDPSKQARYTTYLQSQANQDGSIAPPDPSPGQKIDEFNKELEDYAKAALIYKPISGAMAGRFTSAAIVEHGPKIHEGLHTPSIEELEEKMKEEEKKEEEKISPKAHAARMGMYGPMTREVAVWQPAKLLCKRFGVKDPNPPPDVPVETPAANDNWQEPGAENNVNPTADSSVATRKSGGRRDLANIGLGDDDDQGRDTLTYERPAMDIFKAIFASDDEDSEDDEDAKKYNGEADDDEDASMAEALPAPDTSLPVVATVVQPQATSTVPEKIDISSFKPTFIPRDSKAKKPKDKDKKDKTKKKSGKTLVSFEIEEEGAETQPISKAPKERPKKKKRKERKDEDEDEGMWVEKPPPEILKDLVVKPPAHQYAEIDGTETGPQKGRKRAVDFM